MAALFRQLPLPDLKDIIGYSRSIYLRNTYQREHIVHHSEMLVKLIINLSACVTKKQQQLFIRLFTHDVIGKLVRQLEWQYIMLDGLIRFG